MPFIPPEIKLEIAGHLDSSHQVTFLRAFPEFLPIFPSSYHNKTDRYGYTILHALARNISLATFPFPDLRSIWKKLDLRRQTDTHESHTPLMLAIKYRNRAVLEWLVKEDPRGLNIKLPMRKWERPLPHDLYPGEIRERERGNLDIYCSRSDHFSALHYAIQCESRGAVKVLLAHPSIDINARCCRTAHGMTPLQYAMQCKGRYKFDILKSILDDPRCNVNCRTSDYHEETPLHRAVRDESIREIRLLLRDPRTDVNAANRSGDTAWIKAFRAIYIEADLVVRLLGCTRLDPTLPGEGGATALMRASAQGQTDILDLLLSHSGVAASINQVDERGFSAFMYACEGGKKDAANLLLDSGAQVENSETLLSHAQQSCWDPAIMEIIRVALQAEKV